MFQKKNVIFKTKFLKFLYIFTSRVHSLLTQINNYVTCRVE